MIYADTDFFLALLKKSDWLKERARRLLERHKGEIWTSPVTLTELLLLAAEFDMDPEGLIVDALKLVELRGADEKVFLVAAYYMQEKNVTVFDSIHAAYCGNCKIISSDRVFNKLGFNRIQLEAA